MTFSLSSSDVRHHLFLKGFLKPFSFLVLPSWHLFRGWSFRVSCSVDSYVSLHRKIWGALLMHIFPRLEFLTPNWANVILCAAVEHIIKRGHIQTTPLTNNTQCFLFPHSLTRCNLCWYHRVHTINMSTQSSNQHEGLLPIILKAFPGWPRVGRQLFRPE